MILELCSLCISMLDRLRKRASKPLYHPNPHTFVSKSFKRKNLKNIFSIQHLIVIIVLWVFAE